jgi:hypothetical protein
MRRIASMLLLLAPVAGAQTWTERVELSAPDGSPSDAYGWSVASSGDTVVVGAYSDGLGYTGLGVAGLACDPSRDVLHGVEWNGNQLVAVEKRRGLLRRIGPLSSGVEGVAFDTVRNVVFALGQGVSPPLYAVDPLTGAVTSVGSLANNGLRFMESLAFDPNADVLYSVNAADQLLARIDPTTGAGTVVGSIGSFQWVTALAFDPGSDTLYGIEKTNGELLRLDTTTGAATVIAATGFAGIEGLTYDPVREVLFAWNLPPGGPPPFGGGPLLIELDPATGRGRGVVDSSFPHRHFGAVYVESLVTGDKVKLRASDGRPSDWFGFSVAVAGDTLVVGAVRDDDDGDSSGSAYVFQRGPNGDWSEVAKLTAADAAAGDEFGATVAVSGGTIAVGAQRHDATTVDSGAVYLFERGTGGAWGQVAKLVPTSSTLRFFAPCDIESDRIVVGQPSGKGAAYVYERDAGGRGQWGLVKALSSVGGKMGDAFGQSVALFGDTIAVGAPSTNTQGTQSGSAYVFARNKGGAGAWGQTDEIQMAGGASYDGFGGAVALDGDDLLIGVGGDDNNGSASGSVVFFRRVGGPDPAWAQVHKLLASEGSSWDAFGTSLAMEGAVLIVGALRGDGVVVDSGSAYVFDLTP